MYIAADPSAALAHHLLRASVRSARTLHLYQQVLGCVARKQLDPEELRAQSVPDPSAAITRFLESVEQALLSAVEQTLLSAPSSAPEQTRVSALPRYTQLWFTLLDELNDLRADHLDRFLESALAAARPIGFHGDVVDLTAPHGEITSAEVMLENERSERVAIRCAVSDVRRADGIGPAFLPAIDVTPSEIALDADTEAAVRISLRLDESIYAANTPYVGALQILRDGQPHTKVPLRITAKELR